MKDLTCCLVTTSATSKAYYPMAPSTAVTSLASLAAQKAANPTATCYGFSPNAGTWWDATSGGQACAAVTDATKATNCQAVKFSGNWCCQMTDEAGKQTCQWYTDAVAKAYVDDKNTKSKWSCHATYVNTLSLLMIALMMLLSL